LERYRIVQGYLYQQAVFMMITE